MAKIYFDFTARVEGIAPESVEDIMTAIIEAVAEAGGSVVAGCEIKTEMEIKTEGV